MSTPSQDASPNGRLAPDEFLRRVPERPKLPPNVPRELLAEATDCYRDYLAMTMTMTVDDMLGAILRRLQRDDLVDDTIVVFGSDHGFLMGAPIAAVAEAHPMGGERVRAAGGAPVAGAPRRQCL